MKPINHACRPLDATAGNWSKHSISRPLLAAAAAAIVLAGQAAPAAALAISYSQGTLTIDATRRVTIGPGGDYTSCHAAAASFPKGGPGGVIEFLPGSHTTTCGNLGKRGDILVTGRLGPNGERPRITTPTFTRTNGTTAKKEFLAFNSDGPDVLVVENLDLSNTGRALNVWNYGGMIVRNVRIDNSNGADAIKVNPTAQTSGGAPLWESWLEIYDTEVARGGSANARHNLYLGRIDRVLVDGLYTHSALGSHAFKSIARDLTLRNSTFATTDLGFTDALGSLYLSTTLIDIAACSQSVIEDNTLIGMRIFPSDRPNVPGAGASGISTASFIDLKRRKSKVGGCDDPIYGAAAGFDWAGAAAGGYTTGNDALFHHFIRDNTFINAGLRDLLMVRNVGTSYMFDNGRSFSSNNGLDLPLPEGWFERAVAWLDDNDIKGRPIRPGEEWMPHPDYPWGAPIFVDGIRIGDQPDPRVPITVADITPVESPSEDGHGTSIDEPAALALSGLGFISLAFAGRRHKRAGPRT